MKRSLIVDIVSSLYAVLFFFTGINKLFQGDGFLLTLNKSKLLHPYSAFLVIVIPVLEVAIAIALLLPFYKPASRWRAWGLYCGTILMVLFTGYVWIMLRSPNDLPCSCGGIISEMSWRQHLYFNTVFTLLGILACWLSSRLPKGSSHKLAFT